MATRVWLRTTVTTGPASKKQQRPEPDGRVTRAIQAAPVDAPEDRRTAAALAYPERVLPPGGVKEYRKARRSGFRAFTLWADPYRQQVYAHVVTRQSAEGKAVAYEVLGAAQEPLATVVRDRALTKGIRTRWTVMQHGAAELSGGKGHPVWWFVWWLISPIQLSIIVLSFLGGHGDVARMPRRMKWRRDGRTELDWDSPHLKVSEHALDPRVAAGLVALLESHDGVFGTSWDDDLKF
ncbi:hypothetical protein ACFQVC_03365 [Streptomyces monticola]|uniref:Uncharacterized protein n=1 Tax=Streptomyces monticola TaxID=2666263 RepID=A0ABW2JBQ7_9ACTN